jgi:NhaP-type Na+/H+ or K+/H+ antiporter/CRP-like cAMP-binding protein
MPIMASDTLSHHSQPGSNFNTSQPVLRQELHTALPKQHSEHNTTQSEHAHALDWILFVIIALALGTAARHWGKKLPLVRLFPYTVLLMLLGFGLGIADRFGTFTGVLSSFDDALNWAANIQPSLILFIFLPTLIFEAAFAIDTHTFKKSFVNALILAVPGMIVATILTAVSMMFILDLPDWSWYVALLFGALISATDPVAVVALLRELGASKKLSTLIDGESLLNDGVAIVIFTVFLEYVRMGAGLEALNVAVLSQSFLKTVIGGTVIGLIIAAVTIAWVRRVFNDALVEITVLVIAAYLTFYIAEHFLHVSGILGLMALGLAMSGVGRTRISPQVEHFLHNFWEMAAYLANTLIFIIVGVLIAERTVFSGRDVVNLLLLYVAIHVVRAVMIALFYPLLRRFGYGIAPKDTVILWWGALRGALGLCLCLVVMQENAIPTTIKQQIMFYVAGIVFLTLTINATTVEWIIQRLGLTNVSAARQAMLGNAMQELAKELTNVVLRYKYRSRDRSVRWDAVRNYLPKQHQRSLVQCSDTETLAEIRLRLLESERAFYQHEFHKGLLGADSLRALTSAISIMMDDGGIKPLSDRPFMESLWRLPAYTQKLQSFPLLWRFVQRLQANRLAFIYDTAKACMEAQEHLYTLVCKTELYDINQNDTFDENERQMARTLAAEIRAVHHKAEYVLAELRTHHPNVALAAETVDAIRATLNTELTTIERLHQDGMLKLEETTKLTERVEMQIKALVNYPTVLPEPTPEEIVAELPWLTGADLTLAHNIFALGSRRNIAQGEHILQAGTVSSALYIILNGEVVAERTAERRAEQSASGSQTTSKAPTNAITQSVGVVLGGYSALSGIPEECTWSARTPVSLLSISISTLQSFLASSPSLASALWKWSAAETIESLLHKAGYISDRDMETLEWLIDGTVRHVEAKEKLSLHNTASVLLRGSVRDEEGRNYEAPALLVADTVHAIMPSVVYSYNLVVETGSLIDNLDDEQLR